VNLKPKTNKPWKQKKQQKKGKYFNYRKEKHFARECFKAKKYKNYKRIKIQTIKFRQVGKIPKILLEDNKIVKEVLEILLQSTQNEPKMIEESSTPFYTPAELGLFGIAPKHEEQLDK
jgi:hypothetical protein